MALDITPITKLSDWSVDWVREILDTDREEDTFLEFKADINPINPKDPKEANHTYNIRKALTSFANTLGGFVVFGISDKQKASGWDRLCGIANAKEFGKQLANKASGGKVIPGVTFEGPVFFDIPHAGQTYRVAVVKVASGELKPYAIVTDNDGLLHFWMRGTQTAVAMTYPSLTRAVEASTQLRNWLAALYLDCEYVDTFADQMVIADKDRESLIPVVRINALVNSEQSSQVISLVPNDVELVRLIWALRKHIDLVNSYRDMMVQRRALPLSNANAENRKDNDFIASAVPVIKAITVQLRGHLTKKYPKIREWLSVVQ
ncbi:MAG TPA: ATP-binding protein [Ktedonobacterales bacterium]|nr:ATP-binding protein [Ktedonobacterales bacterium]